MITNPRQIASVFREFKENNETVHKGLIIEQFLFTPPTSRFENEVQVPGEDPLTMHAGYSRFKATILHTSQVKKSFVFANIRADRCGEFIENARAALLLHMKYVSEKPSITNVQSGNTTNISQSNQSQSSIAFTQKIFVSKELRGLTPAAALLSSPDNESKLRYAASWLESHLSDNTGNKNQYDAIMQALELWEKGSLVPGSKETAPIEALNKCPVYEIYSSPINVLEKQKDDKGNVLVYGIQVYCDTEKTNSPFVFEIKNQYAPLNRDGKPMLSEATNKHVETILLTRSEFCNILRRIERTINMFEDGYAAEAMRICYTEEQRNRLQ